MPFKSKAQQGFLYAKHPEIAARFAKKTHNFKDLPEHVKKKKAILKKSIKNSIKK